MRFIFIAVASFVLVVAPVSAQSAQSVNAGEITPAGLLVAVITILVALLGGGGILAAWVNNRFKVADEKRQQEVAQQADFSNLIEAIRTLGQGLSDSSSFAARDRADAAKEREHLRKLIEDSNLTMKTIETKDEVTLNRKSSIQAVNEHTDAAWTATVKRLDELLEPMRNDLKAINHKLDTGVTLAQIKEALQPLQEHLDHIGEKAIDFVVHTGKTDRLNAQIAIDAENARNRASGGDDSTKAS